MSVSSECPASSGIEATASGPASQQSRRMLLRLQRSGLFNQDLKGTVIERACTGRDLREAYRLVHAVHVEKGYIQRHESGIRLRMFEAMPSTGTFVAKKNGRVVGVLSIVFDSPELGLPSDVAFKPELDRLRAEGRRLFEVTNQAIDAAYRMSGVATELMRCGLAYAQSTPFDQVVATVSPGQRGFYRLLGFAEIGGQRSYSRHIHDPVIALSASTDQWRPESSPLEGERFIHSYLCTDNPYHARTAGWQQVAKAHFLGSTLIRRLFVDECDFLAGCSPREVQVLRRLWGNRRFLEVASHRRESRIKLDVEVEEPQLV